MKHLDLLIILNLVILIVAKIVQFNIKKML